MSSAGSFKDHFSKQASAYAKARPLYPEALFQFLAGLPAARDTAWDCGTGNGQAAQALRPYFRRVVATDASTAQISRTRSQPGLLFAAARAENPPLRDGGIDLVTVAQALHWFDFEVFFAAVRKVGKPGSVFAAWGYGNCRVTPEVDAVYDRLYEDILGAYWPPERRHIESGYSTIPLPFPAIACPIFEMVTEWNLHQYLAYLDTWSAVQAYQKRHGANPLNLVRADLERAWIDPERVRTQRWPLALTAGRIKD